jgi:hypothetical protein
MPKIKFFPCDRFVFKKGAGVVLPGGDALIIFGKGGRTGYTTVKGLIPEDAEPLKDNVNYEISLALDAVVCAFGLQGVTFNEKSASQKEDCINRSAEYNCVNPSTLEAIYPHSDNEISQIRCCTNLNCLVRAAKIARRD